MCGTRAKGWPQESLPVLRRKIADWLVTLPPDAVIVHGAANGVDRIAAQEADKLGFVTEPHAADWAVHGRGAGPIRNEWMARLGADLCVAWWNGVSTGTDDMVRRARAHGIPTEVRIP